ncbi:MAG: LysR family transcriptional regulator [Burkholderiales bacterium]|nr:LysR family transcriptional regulator [Burkholderiales bacterium]
MKINIDGIQAFVAIARYGSYQKAADYLKLTQTALTRRIQRLEGYLQVSLLERSTHSVTLTKVGEEFLPQAKRLVEELTWSVDRLKGMARNSSGDVTIACIAHFAYEWLPWIIKKYARKYPGNKVSILDRHGLQVAEAVKLRAAEFGINIIAGKDAELTQYIAVEDPYVLFCHQSDPMSKLKNITWGELKSTELITVGKSSRHSHLVNEQLNRHTIQFRARYEVENLATALGFVSAGLGSAILPSSVILTRKYPSIRQVPLTKPIVRRSIGLIMRRGALLSPAAQSLYQLVEAELKAINSSLTDEN